MFTHNELVLIAAKWVKKSLKFPIVTTELKTTGSREIPDVLAFRSNTSLIIECKTSLIDFKRDFKKPERINQDKLLSCLCGSEQANEQNFVVFKLLSCLCGSER